MIKLVGVLVTWAVYTQGQLLLWSSLIITGVVPGYKWPMWLRLQLSKQRSDLSTLVAHYHDVIISLHYEFENGQVWLGRIHVHAQRHNIFNLGCSGSFHCMFVRNNKEITTKTSWQRYPCMCRWFFSLFLYFAGQKKMKNNKSLPGFRRSVWSDKAPTKKICRRAPLAWLWPKAPTNEILSRMREFSFEV